MKASRTYIISILLLFISSLFAFPFFWMLCATFKNNPDIFTPFPLLPKSFSFEHYQALFTGEWIPYPRQFLNSLYIASVQTILALCLSASAGYLFAKFSFPFKKLFFALSVLVVLIPRQVMVLPLFIWMNDLKLLDGPWAVIFPGMVSGIGILYFTQVYKRVPDELLDLARSEGAGEYRVYLESIFLIKPALIAFGLIHFTLAWQEHLIPLVMLNARDHMTVNVGLNSLYGGSMQIPYGLLMAGSTLTLIPTVVLFILVQKHFKSSLAELTLQ